VPNSKRVRRTFSFISHSYQYCLFVTRDGPISWFIRLPLNEYFPGYYTGGTDADEGAKYISSLDSRSSMITVLEENFTSCKSLPLSLTPPHHCSGSLTSVSDDSIAGVSDVTIIPQFVAAVKETELNNCLRAANLM
jgi:hypothetical protein